MSELTEWDSFYVIVGGAAGALIGLQFVVMTLIADRPSPGIAEAGPVFATPAIVHFSVVLLIAALLRVPWPSVGWAAAACGITGLCGVFYVLQLWRRMVRQSAYKPDAEDWSFHIVLPLFSYLLLALTPLPSTAYERETLFAIGAGALLLLFIGIHNAWDAVAYQVFVIRRRDADKG
jgi:hypothetical protein